MAFGQVTERLRLVCWEMEKLVADIHVLPPYYRYSTVLEENLFTANQGPSCSCRSLNGNGVLCLLTRVLRKRRKPPHTHWEHRDWEIVSYRHFCE